MLQNRPGGFALQRLFSTFPGGSPGVGLLLLRSTVGLTATVQGTLYLSGDRMEQVGAWVAAGLLIVIGASLLLGFLTPAVSVVAAIANLCIMLSWLPPYPWNLLNAKLATAQLIVTSISIAFLGPGAFSLDCRLFGRREINIPKAAPQRRE